MSGFRRSGHILQSHTNLTELPTIVFALGNNIGVSFLAAAFHCSFQCKKKVLRQRLQQKTS